jgi:hypothetical protein
VVALALGLFLLTASCNPMKVVKLSDDATVQLHQRLNEGQDDVIYASAAPDFRKVSSRDDLVRMTSILRRKMGVCGEFHKRRIGQETNFKGTFVTTEVQTTCAKGRLNEAFTWLIQDNRALLLRYAADSPVLHRE